MEIRDSTQDIDQMVREVRGEWWISPCKKCKNRTVDGNCEKASYKKGCPVFREWFRRAWICETERLRRKENEQ